MDLTPDYSLVSNQRKPPEEVREKLIKTAGYWANCYIDKFALESSDTDSINPEKLYAYVINRMKLPSDMIKHLVWEAEDLGYWSYF